MKLSMYGDSLSLNLLPEPTKGWALFLDLDGTIAEIAPTPTDAYIPDEILESLVVIQQNLEGALCIVSGRTLRDIDRLCHPYQFYAIGQHGMELRNNKTNRIYPQITDQIRKNVIDFHSRYPELLIEYKGFTIAFHYRLAPQLYGIIRNFVESQVSLYPDIISLQEGKMVCELKPSHTNKGKALKQMMKFEPFIDKIPVFAGDDLTDEAGFKFVNKHNGISIKIGTGETAAKYRLPNVRRMHEWLTSCAMIHI